MVVPPALSPRLAKTGLRVPIIQAPMAGVATLALALEVCKAGALGSLSLVGLSVAEAASQIRAMKAATAAPFQVNLFCHVEPANDPENETAWLKLLEPHFQRSGAVPPAELNAPLGTFVGDDAMLAMVLELAPPIVSFHLGLPSDAAIRALRIAGIEMMVTVTSQAEARMARRAGIQILVAQGAEAGGHRGIMDLALADELLPTRDLLTSLRIFDDVDLVAAGGAMDGADIAGLLALGAGAVQMGTAFLCCDEAATSAPYRRAIHASGLNSTVITRAVTGRPARAIANALTTIAGDDRAIPDFPLPASASAALTRAAADRSIDLGAYWAGTGSARARAMPVRHLIATLQAEMAHHLRTTQ